MGHLVMPAKAINKAELVYSHGKTQNKQKERENIPMHREDTIFVNKQW